MKNTIPRYAVVDIETTGGDARTGRITEIAIFVVEGGEVVDEFVSLINPEKPIPPFISQLTGITDEMVEGAPRFFEVARKVVEVTSDTIFVAHNAPFDYNFIRNEFKSLGYDFNRDVLCTVRLSRKIIPGMGSYSLGKLCGQLGLPLSDRHRASGDARATVLLLNYLVEKNGDWITPQNMVGIKDLHPDLDVGIFRNIPATVGLYYFYNEERKVIYVGKSKNIHKRVLSQLSAKGKRNLTIKSHLTDITFEETGSELLALLKELDQINNLKPEYNKAGKSGRVEWGVFDYIDQKGYERFFLQKVNNTGKPIEVFASRQSARKALLRWADQYQLCHRLCGLDTKTGPCFSYSVGGCKGACAGMESPENYNIRALKLKRDLGFENPDFVLFDCGRKPHESSFVWVHQQAVKGYGWVETDQVISHPFDLEPFIAGGSDNPESRRVVRAFLQNKRSGKLKMVKY